MIEPLEAHVGSRGGSASSPLAANRPLLHYEGAVPSQIVHRCPRRLRTPKQKCAVKS